MMVYFPMALALFAEEDYEEVMPRGSETHNTQRRHSTLGYLTPQASDSGASAVRHHCPQTTPVNLKNQHHDRQWIQD